jgi:hypothetical protein
MRHFPSPLSHVIYAQNIPFEINTNRFVHNSRILHRRSQRMITRNLARTKRVVHPDVRNIELSGRETNLGNTAAALIMPGLAVRLREQGGALGQRSQHADTRMHHVVAIFGGADQATDGDLPFLEILLGLRQFRDVVGGIAQSQ